MNANPNRGPYLAQSAGRPPYYLLGTNDVEPDWIAIHDVLSVLKRFVGWSPVSVLQHELVVYDFLREAGYNKATCDGGFFHDHHEAMIGDIPHPIKILLGDAWEEIEAHAEESIRKHFDFTGADIKAIAKADVVACAVEAVEFGIAADDDDWITRIMRIDGAREMFQTMRVTSRIGMDHDTIVRANNILADIPRAGR